MGVFVLYNENEKKILIQLANDSIEYGLQHHQQEMPINTVNFSHNLQKTRATFVTLEMDHRLRGCIGSLRAHRPLVNDVVSNANKAAFHDPRFSPVTIVDAAKLVLKISVLTEPVAMQFVSELDLLSQLEPNVHGLIIQDQGRQATFLPQVWETLPDPQNFLAHLKQKAGLPAGHWSPTFKAFTYQVELI